MDGAEALVAPPNFSQVESGVYRSGEPKAAHLAFLSALGLKTVVSLGANNAPNQEVKDFYASAGITLIFHDLARGNRKHNIHADRDTTARALETLMDKANHPVLLHCKKGKHRTGCIIGLLRKQRGWAFSSIFTEYCGFEPQAKSREEDERFIEDFELESYIATNGVIS
jgi:tyrosine-protein phosphatase SIW14